MDKIAPLHTGLFVLVNGARKPLEITEPPFRSTGQCLAHLPPGLRPVNDEDPPPPEAA